MPIYNSIQKIVFFFKKRLWGEGVKGRVVEKPVLYRDYQLDPYYLFTAKFTLFHVYNVKKHNNLLN